MRSRQPAVAVKFVVIEVILADQFGILRTTSSHAVADVEDDQPVAPVGEVCNAIFDLQVVQIATTRHRSHLGIQRDHRRVFHLEPRNLLGMLRVLKINDAQRARRIVGKIHVMTVDVSAVHPAADRRRVLGEHLQMRGVRSVEEDDAVLAVGRSLAREDTNLLVRRGADVVDEPCIDLQRIEQFGICRIGDVIDEEFVSNRGEIGVVADDPLFRHHHIRHGHVGHDFDFSLHTARTDHHRRRRAVLAAACGNDIGAGLLRDESAIGIDSSAASSDRPTHWRLLAAVGCREVHHIAGASVSRGRLDA